MKVGLVVVTAHGSCEGKSESHSFWEEGMEFIGKIYSALRRQGRDSECGQILSLGSDALLNKNKKRKLSELSFLFNNQQQKKGMVMIFKIPFYSTELLQLSFTKEERTFKVAKDPTLPCSDSPGKGVPCRAITSVQQ